LSRLLYHVGRASIRHRRLVLAIWLAAVVAIFVPAAGKTLRPRPQPARSVI
jgi:uncharacterized membrane protein YdfJ with MMPL/SSD domain